MPTFSTEIWKPVPEFEGYYEVSNFGRVRSVERVIDRGSYGPLRVRGKMMQQHVVPRGGHHQVKLSRNNKIHYRFTHHLVAELFIGPRPAGLLCLHRDGDAANNHADNLYYGTHQQNTRDAMRHGAYPSGEKHFNAKLTADTARMIYWLARSGFYTRQRIATWFGVSQSVVSNIALGKAWKSAVRHMTAEASAGRTLADI